MIHREEIKVALTQEEETDKKRMGKEIRSSPTKETVTAYESSCSVVYNLHPSHIATVILGYLCIFK
jgi:hypothetical protein